MQSRQQVQQVIDSLIDATWAFSALASAALTQGYALHRATTVLVWRIDARNPPATAYGERTLS